MSRIGKKPITFPKNVKISQSAGMVKVEGPKGTLIFEIAGRNYDGQLADGNLVVERKSDEIACPVLSWFSQNLNQTIW